MSSLPILGWKEHASLPDWGIDHLRVKLDTGARSSALHVENLVRVDDSPTDGHGSRYRFHVLTGSRDTPVRQEVVATAVGHKIVRDTGARAEMRPVFRTRFVCGPLDLLTDLTVTDRSGMNFRMLVGRLTMQGLCLVDPEQGYLHSEAPPSRQRTTR